MTTTLGITGYYSDHYVLPANTNLNVFPTGDLARGVSSAYGATIVNDGRINGTAQGEGGTEYDGVQFTRGGTLINGNYAYSGALVEGRAGILVSGGQGTITNFGTIRNTDALYAGPDSGVDLFSGGTVTNGAAGLRTALISGEWGVFVENAPGAVVNFATIVAERPGAYAAVQMTDSGTVINGSAGDFTALLRGGVGVDIKGSGGGLVDNFGTIVGSVQQGAVLYNGGNVTNGTVTDTGASISGVLQGVGLVFAGTVANFGSILGSGAVHGDTGAELNSGGKLTNGAANDLGAAISGYSGVLTGGPATVINYGAISGLGAARTEFGAYLEDGGTVTNGSALDATASIQGGVGVEFRGAVVGGLANFGTIVGSVQQGVVLYDAGNVTNGSVADNRAQISGVQQGVGLVFAGTVNNFGAIFGAGAVHGDTGVELNSGGQLTNGAGGDLVAAIDGYTGALLGGPGTVSNYGTIKGVGASQYERGVYLLGGGRVTNGTSQDGAALIEGGVGVAIANASGFVGNYGTILGQGLGNTFAAVEVRAGGFVENGAPGETTALVQGGSGVRILGGAYGGVENFGAIVGSRTQGVAIYESGFVDNGAGNDTAASISGRQFGVKLYATGSVTNFGAIEGTGVYQGSVGVYMAAGGGLANGTAHDLGATISGYTGIQMSGAGSVTNYGTISGLGASIYDYGVSLTAGGTVTNGSGTDRAATIQGDGGVVISGAAGVIKNAGTLLGSTGFGAQLLSGGAFTNGSVSNAAAVVEGYAGLFLNGGSAVNFGTISGQGDYSLGVRIESGATVTNGAAGHAGALIEGYLGVNAYAAAGQTATVTNFGTIAGLGAYAVFFGSSTCVLNVEAGSTFVGEVDGGGGTLDLASGTGTLSDLLSAGGNVTVSGSMATTTFQNFGTVEVGAGATFTDSGAVTTAVGQSVNDAGTLTLGGPGVGSIVNAGLIETTGTGVLTVNGAVTGKGHAAIDGGTLDLASSFTQNVTFTKTGVLELAQSQGYTGTITGFSKTGGASLDLVDIAFVGSGEATFSGTTASGVLTVTDGTHTAHINLKGNFTTSTWIASSDGHGGTIVIDPKAKGPLIGSTQAGTAHQFIAAMASLGAPAGAAIHAPQSLSAEKPVLAGPHAMMA